MACIVGMSVSRWQAKDSLNYAAIGRVCNNLEPISVQNHTQRGYERTYFIRQTVG